MIRNHRPVVFAAVVLTAFVSVLFSGIPTAPRIAPPMPIDDTPIADAHRADASPAYRSEKSRRMTMLHAGYPDRFADYAREIRTRPGDDGPTYAPNYRMEALRTARAAAKSGSVRLPWIERGPFNVGGRTRAILVDPGDPTHRTWIVGAVGGGLWKTTNAGLSWTELAPDLPNLSIASLAQAASNPDVLYAGTGEGFGNLDGIDGAGIFTSTDRGQTWTQLAATASDARFRAVNRLIVSPNDPNVVLAATNTGIYRSTDGGAVWDEVYRSDRLGEGARGGAIQQIVADPTAFHLQYATENGVGVLKSTDAGHTWTLASNGLGAGIMRVEIAVAPSRPSRLYAAAEAGENSHLYMSDDAAGSWIRVVESNAANEPGWLGAQGWYDNTIAVHPFSADTVFFGGINIWKSNLFLGTRQISDFTALEENGTGAFLDFVNFSSGTQFDGQLATGVDVGALELSSSDFVSVELRFGPGMGQKAHRFTVSPTAGTNSDGGAGVAFPDYRYADYVDVPFEAWDVTNNRQLMVSFRDQADDGVYNLIEEQTSGTRNEQSREYVFMHALPYDPGTPTPQVAQNGGLIYKMLYFMWPFLPPGGAWNPAGLPTSNLRIRYETFNAQLRLTRQLTFGSDAHVDHHHLTLIPLDAAANRFMIVNGNDGGVDYSENSGGRWLSTDNGYNTAQFYGVDKKPGFNVYIGGTQDNGTWRSFNNPSRTSGWIASVGGDGFDVIWHPTNDQQLIASTQFNGLVRSVNGGIRWDTATSGLIDSGQPNGQFVTTLGHSDAAPDRVFTIGRSGVWRSTDFATNWTLVSLPMADWNASGALGSGKVRVSRANPEVVWAGYRMDNLGRLHVSTNGGFTFTAVNTPPGGAGRLSGLATHPHDDQTAYAIFSFQGFAKIFRTTNLGQTWEDLSGFAGSATGQSQNGFPDVAVYDLLVMPQAPSVLWAGTEIGLFVSTDHGQTWRFDEAGLPAVSIWQMQVVDEEVVVATHGRGVWTIALNAVATADEAAPERALPERFRLAQNYPNPFNPTTTIAFDIPRPATVSVVVYDVAGRKVATLAAGDLPAGAHQVTWNAHHLASGVYFYRLEAGDFVETKTLTLLK